MDELHNVAIFVDYENIYKSLLPEKKNLLRMGFFENLRDWCKQQGQRIVKIVSYCNYDNQDLYESYHQTKLQEYGVETVHTSNHGKNYADLQLTIDVLNLMYLNNNIDEFIIISSDKDMSPLINAIKANKRKVVLITANDSYDPLLDDIPDEILQIKDIYNGRECIEPKILDAEKSILEIFDSFCKKKVEEARTQEDFKHSEIEYLLSTYVKRFNIMKYEMANIFSRFISKGSVLTYKYTFKGKDCTALITKDAKEMAVVKGLISEEDFIKEFDCEQFIAFTYAKYMKNDR